MPTNHLSAKHRLGLGVFILLAALNVLEYWLAVAFPSGIFLPLVVLAAIDAGLILYFFMHVAQLWGHEE